MNLVKNKLEIFSAKSSVNLSAYVLSISSSCSVNPPMSKSMATALFLCICALSSLLCASSSSASICSHQSTFFLNTLNSQSPLSYSPSSPLQVGGDLLDRTLSSKGANAYTSVLFYASWCPFSHNVVSTFEVLSSMFPQINHLAVEESSVVPSILLRYGVHSFPTILMVKQTSIMRFHNAKDLPSLIRFYRKTTGWEPVHYVAMEQPVNFGSSRDFVMQSWVGSSPNEILRREPYLVVSLLFLCLIGFIYIFPKVLLHLKALWVSHGPHLNLKIFGETSQILGRVLQMIDLKMIGTKLKLWKTSNFLRGAKNARVWASSLASVSLGKTSLCRSSS